MLGGALGAAGRCWPGGALLRRFGSGIPHGTLAANIIGSFVVGFLAIGLEGRGAQARYWRAFLIVGVLGALATYSRLILECLLFARAQRNELLAAYLGGTLLAGVLLVWAGVRLAEVLRGTG